MSCLGENTELLFNSMQQLIDAGIELSNEMDILEISSKQKIALNNLKREFDYNIDLIKLHLHLSDARLADFDFYSTFKCEFIDAKSQCIRFSVQEGLNEPRYDLTDDEFVDAYTIKGCLPIMGLVPFQIASNVKKYMPNDLECEINIRKLPSDSYITITNYGPKIKESDLAQILDSGGRGHDSVFVAGMGLGLKQIQNIIKLHNSWLGSTFYATSSNDGFQLNGIEYTKFTIKLRFLNEPNLTLYDNHINEIKQSPTIIIHNLFGITNKLRILSNSTLLRQISNKFRIYLQYLIDVMRQYLYAINSQQLTTSIIGNDCRISMQSVIDNSIRDLRDYVYADKNIILNICKNQTLAPIEASSGFYSFVVGLLSLIFEKLPSYRDMNVTYDGDRNCNLITISSVDCNFLKLFEVQNDVDNNRILFYKDLIQYWGGKIIIKENRVQLFI